MAKQNEVSQGYFTQTRFKQREPEILQDVITRTGFMPGFRVGESRWWGSSKIGAAHYAGRYEDKKVILKIQGVKPSTSEALMIDWFEKTNKSKVIRPPGIYRTLAWDELRGYEALIMEDVGNQRIEDPRTFFDVYQDYRENCLGSAWLEKPQGTISERLVKAFKQWKKQSKSIYPEHPLRGQHDEGLIDQAIEKLKCGYEGIEPEFVHGHFSTGDLYRVEHQVVLLSNLYWSWRPPQYDAVFGYHWFMYHLADDPEITPQRVEILRSHWLKEITGLPQVQGKEGQRLLQLALLERATAGLNLDGLSMDPHKPISGYILETTRNSIRTLLKQLQ